MRPLRGEDVVLWAMISMVREAFDDTLHGLWKVEENPGGTRTAVVWLEVD